MKTACFIFSILILAACNGNQKSTLADTSVIATKAPDTGAGTQYQTNKKNYDHITITPYPLIEGYMVTDTGELDAVTNSGKYMVIRQNGNLIDTIERDLGMRKVGDDCYLYQKISGTASADNHGGKSNMITGDFGNYILITNGEKQDLAGLTKGFDHYFSSAKVINDKIYFWQLIMPKGSEMYKISAAQYDPANHLTKEYYLFTDDLGSDDAGYFPGPYLKNDTIYFSSGTDKIARFSKDFKPVNLKN